MKKHHHHRHQTWYDGLIWCWRWGGPLFNIVIFFLSSVANLFFTSYMRGSVSKSARGTLPHCYVSYLFHHRYMCFCFFFFLSCPIRKLNILSLHFSSSIASYSGSSSPDGRQTTFNVSSRCWCILKRSYVVVLCIFALCIWHPPSLEWWPIHHLAYSSYVKLWDFYTHNPYITMCNAQKYWF